jgi:hypothetical protein
VLVLLRAGRGDRREDLDLTRFELGAQGRKLVVFELVLERERLESALLDRALLLRLFEDGLDRCFVFDRAQFRSLPSFEIRRRGCKCTHPHAHLQTPGGSALFLEQRFQTLEIALQLLAGT